MNPTLRKLLQREISVRMISRGVSEIFVPNKVYSYDGKNIKHLRDIPAIKSGDTK